MGLDARLVPFVFACLPVLFLFCFVFYYRKQKSGGDYFSAS